MTENAHEQARRAAHAEKWAAINEARRIIDPATAPQILREVQA